MKKNYFICSILLIFLCSVNAFSQEKSEAFIETDAAIKKAGRFFKPEEISVPAANLTDEERIELYAKYEKSTKKAALLNGLVGFGSGSFATKGYISGACLLAGEGCCWYCATLGIIMLNGFGTDEPVGEIVGTLFGGVFTVLGVGGILASRGIGVGVACANTRSYNKKLQNSLGAVQDQDLNVSFAPVFNPINKEAGLIVSLKL